MTFSNLPQVLQDAYMYQAELLLKFILFFIIIGVSIFYLFYYKKNYEQPTEFFSVGLIRSLMTLYSFSILLTTPFIFVMFHPSYLFNNLYTIYISLYAISMLIFIVIMFMDVTRFLPSFILKMAGIKIDSKFYNYATRWFKRHFK